MKNFKFAGLALIGMLVLGSCSVVSPQEVGLKVSKAGGDRGVSNVSVANGYVTYFPFTTSVVKYPRTVQTIRWGDKEDPNNPELGIRSKGGVRVTAPINVQFQVVPDKAPSIYSNYGASLDITTQTAIKTQVQKTLNDVGSQYTPTELVGEGSVLFEEKVTAVLSKKLEAIGFNLVTFSLPEGVHPPTNISETIDATQRAKQDALRVENELASTKAEAQKVIAKADGDAKAAILRADGAAKANRILAQSLTPELIEYQKIQKWNGQTPSTVLSDGTGTLVTVK